MRRASSRRSRRVLRRVAAKSGVRPFRVALRHRGLRPGDVFLASYPRSGNTWLRFILASLLGKVDPSFEYVNQNVPYIGRHGQAAPLVGSARLIKTHETYSKRYRRSIYLVRDPRSVVLSEHNFQTMHGYVGPQFDRFFGLFTRGAVHGLGSWGDHVQSWRRPVEQSRALLVRFEDLRANPSATVRCVVDFLGVEASADEIDLAISRNTLDRMRAKEDQSSLRKARANLRHVNQGDTMGWKHRLTCDQIHELESLWGDMMSDLGYSSQASGRDETVDANLDPRRRRSSIGVREQRAHQ